jgi:hypothetical protein
VICKASHFVRAICSDTRGVILPYMTFMLVVIVGLSVLALDGARLMGLQTSLQAGADALALAGAAELDRLPDSITRAANAINTLVENPTLSGVKSAELVRVADVQFLRSLPADDGDPISADNVTTDPTRARFVQVIIEPVTLSTILPASIFGGSSNVTVSAQAVAGFDQVLCNSIPLFVCNPFETEHMTYYEATQALVEANNDKSINRKLVRLISMQSKKAANAPGDFGYVRPATGALPANTCGPRDGEGVAQAMAVSRIRACIKLSGINVQSSDDQAAMDGLNTRFDIYANSFKSCINYAPDENVRRGYVVQGNTNWCIAAPSAATWPLPNPSASPLPVDENMVVINGSGNQELDTRVTVGDGVWDCAAYWNIAHFAGPGREAPPPGCSKSATISRYDVYRYEMSYLGDRSRANEIGAPRCSPPGVSGRRVVHVPIVNCNSSPVAVQNNSQNVPVAAFGRFFLVLPANRYTGGSLYAEFLGLVSPTDKLSRDIVQLYR